MKKWDVSMKPAEYAEFQLVDAILTGEFPINSFLPGERELAEQMGVTRPTLREVLQRMARDGWIDIQHGKATRIKNYLIDGNLGVLSSITQHQNHIQPDFVANLMILRRLLAPEYTRLAVEKAAEVVIKKLAEAAHLSYLPENMAAFDWQLHHCLAVNSGNPVFPLLLNGFFSLYQQMGRLYFVLDGAVDLSRQFYIDLMAAVQVHDSLQAQTVCETVMEKSEQLWQNFAMSKNTIEGAGS